MKKYFTKFLAVEGEIKEGDRVLLPSGQIVKAVQETLGLCWWRKDGSAYQKINKNDKKLKLFLCSRDIKVGDNVQYRIAGKEEECVVLSKTEFAAYTNLRLENKGIYFNAKQEDCIKVIGEISPDAIWVTRGMEFDEEDMKWLLCHTLNGWEEVPFEEGLKISYIEQTDGECVLIKCPTCKTFH